MEELAGYEEAYKGLSSLVKVSGNAELKEATKEIDVMMNTNKQAKKDAKTKQENTPDISKEEFADLGYMERVKLNNEHPELYNKLVGGK